MISIDNFISVQQQAMYEQIGKAFRECRESNNWTIQEAARVTGYSANKIERIENGKYKFKSINIGVIAKLATYYGRQLRLELADIPPEAFAKLKEPLLRFFLQKCCK